jgi:endonuclease YncB( thermonuclease family)
VTIPPDWTRWTYAARVVSSHDADTVGLAIDAGLGVTVHESCRLLGIQAAEVGGPNVSPEEKAAGFAARDRLREILAAAGNAVIVRTKKDTREGRGRYLATLYVVEPDGSWRDVCQQLVDEGHAVAYDGKSKAPKWTPEGWRAAS